MSQSGLEMFDPTSLTLLYPHPCCLIGNSAPSQSTVDNDGHLDLLVGTHDDKDKSPGIPLLNRLHRNDGTGKFVEVEGSSIAAAAASTTYAVAWGDYDVRIAPNASMSMYACGRARASSHECKQNISFTG